MGTAVSAVDRAVVAAMHMHGARDRARAVGLGHDERIAVLSQIRDDYADLSFFPAPQAIAPTLRPVRRGAPTRTEVFDASWPSTYEPFLDVVRDKVLAHVENRTARARLIFGEHRAPARPAIICIHGYMGGHFLLEEAQLPIAWLTKRGLDVALPVLPFHGARGGLRRGAPPFPSADPRLTNEGFRQAVADIGALARHLRERGAPQVGVMGMSLGGYTTALLATVLPDLDFAMPMIPLASVADFAREQGQLGEGAEADAQHAALERANWVVSPFARPSLVPSSRMLVVAAEYDRITGMNHGRRLATHFEAPLVTIPGGHMVQLGRKEAFRALGRMLESANIMAPRPRSART